MINYKNVKVIDCSDFDKLVEETYNRPYCFQQQEGCKERGTFTFEVPNDYSNDEEMNDSIPEIVNHGKMGVKFNVWLERDPKQILSNPKDQFDWSLRLWWERNFYPDIYTLVNDLHKKGLIETGEYTIRIDW